MAVGIGFFFVLSCFLLEDRNRSIEEFEVLFLSNPKKSAR